MNAYLVTLRLYEREDPEEDWKADPKSDIKIITVAETLMKAAEWVPLTYKNADNTEETFDWRVVHAVEIEGVVALPAFPQGVQPDV